MADPEDIVDIDSLQPPQPVHPATHRPPARPWLAIHWRCCSVYSRVYRNAQADVYVGRCPRCGRSIRVRVGENGTSSRFFEAS